MRFQDFVKNRQVRRSSPDISLIRSLVSTAQQDLRFLDSLPINTNSARKIMSNYYDVLRSVLEAIASVDGYKIYSHEAFTYFLREKGEQVMAHKFERFRKIRNGINYYGKSISIEEVKEHVIEMKKLLVVLQQKYLKEGKSREK